MTHVECLLIRMKLYVFALAAVRSKAVHGSVVVDCTSKMHLSPPVALAAVCSKAVVLLLLIRC